VIGCSTAVLHHHKDGAIVLDVHDVGYEVSVASRRTTASVTSSISIFTVRDDAICSTVPSYLDREFFELLLVTPGVGPRPPRGLRTMSTGTSPRIERDDAKTIGDDSGHRTQDRSRIVLELKGKSLSRTPTSPPNPPAERRHRRRAGTRYSTQRFARPSVYDALRRRSAALRQALQL